jgi:Glycosyl transferase family 11
MNKITFWLKLKALYQAILVTIYGWNYFYKNIAKETLIISIGDGIGNQLFKYAFGWSIAESLSKKCAVDTLFFHGDNVFKRTYKLDELGIQADRISASTDLTVHQCFHFFYYLKIINKILPYVLRVYVHESDVERMRFDNITRQFSNNRRCLYFHGYWEKLDYVARARQTIQSQILTSCQISDRAKQWLEKIQRQEAVAIHIRQVQFPRPLQSSYYLEAINLIKTLIPDPEFYIFADDWEWVKENLSFLSSTNLMQGNNDIDDFYLLLYSKNTIVANSTFSWWAAYLKPHEDATIIVPETYGSRIGLPDKWIQLKLPK